MRELSSSKPGHGVTVRITWQTAAVVITLIILLVAVVRTTTKVEAAVNTNTHALQEFRAALQASTALQVTIVERLSWLEAQHEERPR